MPMLDNQRHEIFAQELVQGKTADEAYVIAGYKKNKDNASRLKANESILARIEELKSRVATGVVITRQKVLEELAKLAFAEIGHQHVRSADKRNALIDMARLEGWIIERSENGKPGDFSRMDDKELEQFIANHKAAIPANLNKKRA